MCSGLYAQPPIPRFPSTGMSPSVPHCHSVNSVQPAASSSLASALRTRPLGPPLVLCRRRSPSLATRRPRQHRPPSSTTVTSSAMRAPLLASRAHEEPPGYPGTCTCQRSSLIRKLLKGFSKPRCPFTLLPSLYQSGYCFSSHTNRTVRVQFLINGQV